MASKGIDIAIGATYDNSGVVEANKSLAALYADVRDRSESARQAVLKEAEAYSSVAAQADKMAKAVGGSYVDLEQEANALEQKIRDAFDAAHAAAIEAKYGTESFEKVLQRANKAVMESNRLNNQAAQIAEVLKKKREELAQITDKESAAYLKLSHEVKVLEKAQEEFGGAVKNSGDEAQAFGISLNDAMSAAHGNTNALIKIVLKLKDSFGVLKNVSVGAIGAAGAAIASIISLVGALKDLVVTAFNLDQPSADVKKINAAFNDLNNKAETFKTAMDDARKASERMTKAFEDQANALAKVAKAQNALKREQELAAAKTDNDRAKINAQYDSADKDAEEEAAQAIRDRRRQSINEERNRVRAEIDNAKKMMREYRKLFTDGGATGTDDALNARETIEEKKKSLEDLNRRLDILDKEDEAAAANTEARRIREERVANEIEQKRLDDEKKIAEKKAEEEKKLAEKTSKEKAKQDELAQKRLSENIAAYQKSGTSDSFDDWLKKRESAQEKELEGFKKYLKERGIAYEGELNAENEDFKNYLATKRSMQEKSILDQIKAENGNADKQKAIASAAQSEFDKAFGMYRDRDLAARTIAEERDYAADYKQLQKDASRYGGKWRIDELSALMAAGDTKGQAAKLEEWRKSSRFTPEVESLVRAAAADQTRTTAEDELRKISANTEGLAKKLDDLLALK